jgi:hypothetical protein
MFRRAGQNIPGGFLHERSLDCRTLRRNGECLLVLGTLFLLDIMTTQIILRHGGIELNPIMAGIVLNPVLHVGIKATILLLVFPVSLFAEQRVKGSSLFLYLVLIALYAGVVINNILIIVPGISH